MGKKYLDTKEDSLESSILAVWQEAAKKQEKLDPVGKEDDDVDNDGDVDSSDKYLAKRRKAISKAIKKDEGAMKRGKDLDTFKPKPKKEEGELDELIGAIPAGIAGYAAGKLMSAKKHKKIKKEEVQIDEIIGAVPAAAIGFALGKENVKKHLAAGKMSQLHQLMKDGKTAEEIAKIMRVDTKTIKKLMGESYEIGTDEYRKHTEDVTPGEDGEWTKHINQKSQSMREALAQVWNVNEGSNPFAKKALTKEVKDGKTMTGKKIAAVDINPTIKEKTK